MNLGCAMGRVGPGFGSGNPPTWQPAGGSGCQPKTLPGRTRSQNGLKWVETAILGNFFQSQNKNPPTGWVGLPKWQPGPAPWAGFAQGRVGYPLPIVQPSQNPNQTRVCQVVNQDPKPKLNQTNEQSIQIYIFDN